MGLFTEHVFNKYLRVIRLKFNQILIFSLRNISTFWVKIESTINITVSLLYEVIKIHHSKIYSVDLSEKIEVGAKLYP